MGYTTEEKCYCVEAALAKTSFSVIRRQFSTHFNGKVAPAKTAIIKWVSKLREYGTLHNLNSKGKISPTHSGRKTTNRSHKKICTQNGVMREKSKKRVMLQIC